MFHRFSQLQMFHLLIFQHQTTISPWKAAIFPPKPPGSSETPRRAAPPFGAAARSRAGAGPRGRPGKRAPERYKWFMVT